MNDFGSTEISAADLEGTPSAATLTEMIIAQHEALSSARAQYGRFSRTVAAHEATFRKLLEGASAAGSPTAPSELDRALRLSNLFHDTAALNSPGGWVKRGLKGFHLEALRPQVEFNRALVEVLKSVLGSPPSDRGWVRRRLGSLADPTAWRVKSHRAGLKGPLVELSKRAYLKAVGPLLEVALARQREWNQAVIAVLEKVGHEDIAPRVAELERLGRDPGSESASVWQQLLRGQSAFNQHIARLLSGPAARGGRSYPDWVAAREGERLAQLRPVPAGTFTVLVPVSTAQGVAVTLASIRAQSILTWEVQLVADPNLDTATRAQLQALTNSQVSLTRNASAKKEWVTRVEPGDRLAPHAFAEIAAAAKPDVALVYSDEDRLDDLGHRSDPFFKPDLAIELLSSCDLVSRGLFVRSPLFVDLPDLYDLVWREVEKGAALGHVAEILYTRAGRENPRSRDFVSASGQRALEAHVRRVGINAVVARDSSRYHVRPVRIAKPLVSIIVPFKDKPALLKALLQSLDSATAYQNFEVILVSNNSVEPQTLALLASLENPRITAITWDEPFHYSKLNNFGAQHARGELLLFLNNDIEAFDPAWLDALLDRALDPEVAVVGAKLLFPDRTLQHAGVVVGMGGFAGHVFAGLPDDGRWTAFGRVDWGRDCLAVTSACLMMRRDLFEALKGFDERFTVCGGDVDLCLRAAQGGKRVVYTPHSILIHHESASRRNDQIPTSDFWESFRAYQPFLSHDPGFSPRLSLASTDPRLRAPEEPGPLEFALQVLGSKGGLSGGRVTHTRRVQGMARTLDFGSKDLGFRAAGSRVPRRLTWFLPFFDHPFGGVHTLLRFADEWRRNHGVENQFVIYDNPHVTAREMEAKVATIFPVLPGKFEVLKSAAAVENLAECDFGIATMWTGAYFLLRHPRVHQRAYFVQDYEPMFYPAGTLSALASNTYDLGFLGLFNTRGLHDYVTAQHPMTGAWFEPAVDHALFHSHGRTRSQKPVRVFFYGRPSIDRNGFELGIEALRQLKARRGDDVQIFAAGEAWDPATFEVEGVLENFAVLPYEETARLYRTTDVGLCFMFTRHPSYLPLEMMACGVTVVTNENAANDWLFSHRRNCLLARPTASCVAEQLVEAVENSSLREEISAEASRRMQITRWDEQAEKIWRALSTPVLGEEAS